MKTPKQQFADAHRRLAVAPKNQILSGEKDRRFLNRHELPNPIQMCNQNLRFIWGDYCPVIAS